ncbi:MAG: CPBP family intramembrane metalloprotease [Bacteroidales bacterium]|nr:CPBP family intramembrane metalloprotease [Bacteroidales bacterium]
MKSTGIFSYFSPGVKFFWLILIFILFAIISAFGGLMAGKFMHLDMTQMMELSSNPMPGENTSFLYLFQFINQLGLFILAPLLYVFLFEKPTIGGYLKLNKIPGILILFLSVVTIYTLLPFINFLDGVNAHLSLPKAFSSLQQWMVDKETQADQITALLLNVNTLRGLMLNLFVVALMPALGEELLFRGIIQQLLQKWTKKSPLAVILTAFIFSAIHLQFFGFLPRFVLGLLLGYLFLYTRSLWVPMLVHFVNNASSVVIYYLNYNGNINVSADHFGSWPSIFGISSSLLITLVIVYFVKVKSVTVPQKTE